MEIIRQRLASSQTLQALVSVSGVMFARVGGTLATLAYTVLLTRLLAPEDFGTVSALWALALLLVPLATLNLAPVAIKEVVAARHAGDEARARGFVRFAWHVIAFMAVPACALFAAIVAYRYGLTGREAWIGATVLALTIPLSGLVQVWAATGVAYDRAVLSQIPREFLRPLIFLLILLAVYGAGYDLSSGRALSILALGAGLTFLAQFWALRIAVGPRSVEGAAVANGRNLIETGFFLLPTRLLNENAKLLMIVIASAVLPMSEVARVTVALSIAGLLSFAVTAVEVSFSAKLSRALHAKEDRLAQRLFATALVAKLVVLVIGALALALFLTPILRLFGDHYIESRGLVWIVVAIPFVKALFGKADLVLLVHGARRRIFWVQSVTLALLPLGAFGVLQMGGGTAAVCIGFVAAFTFGSIALWLSARHMTGMDPSILGALSVMRRVD
ncbi:hypothetical protein [Celeribacter arenosi]|uniref:Membrane protein involved in the export of O-antigen and teichoic acid n=1 Tax=Celeribacter arenosi TaxID=792649 RepID=A0ABP7JRR1_9RHOB